LLKKPFLITFKTRLFTANFIKKEAMKISVILLLSVVLSFAGIRVNPFMYPDTDNPESAIFIHWVADSATDACTLHYGLHGVDYSQSAPGIISTDVQVSSSNGATYTHHHGEVHLTGLVPHGKYQWFLVVQGDTSEMGSFQLDPGEGGSFKIALTADTHFGSDTAGSNNINSKKYYDYAATAGPELICVLGDYTDNGLEQEFINSFNSHPALYANSIFLPVSGNHDRYAEFYRDLYFWKKYFPNIPTTLDPELGKYESGLSSRPGGPAYW
jgi:hypothetical protein